MGLGRLPGVVLAGVRHVGVVVALLLVLLLGLQDGGVALAGAGRTGDGSRRTAHLLVVVGHVVLRLLHAEVVFVHRLLEAGLSVESDVAKDALALGLGVGSGRGSNLGEILGRPVGGILRRPGRLGGASGGLDGGHSLIIVAVEDATLHDGPAVRGSLASLRVILELGNAVTDRLGGDVKAHGLQLLSNASVRDGTLKEIEHGQKDLLVVFSGPLDRHF
ncbi:hypothetical protein HDK64DRAFT_263105 [Phyllosticta capitalensis]